MLNAHFAMAFDFTRAIQSTFNCVFCLSGAFSAYRVSVLDKFVDRWLNQRFMNVNCTYGEDRSLTNYVLREGHHSFFQRSAISFTIVPEQILKILKMFTRWARSNIRESIVFSGFVFSPNRRGNIILPFIDFFFTISLIMLHFMWFYYFLFSGLIDATFLFRILSYSVFFGFFYALYFLRIEGKKDSPYIIFFSVFSSFFVIWIFTIAGFTLTKKGWSTR
jgi:hyaluronan synthase